MLNKNKRALLAILTTTLIGSQFDFFSASWPVHTPSFSWCYGMLVAITLLYALRIFAAQRSPQKHQHMPSLLEIYGLKLVKSNLNHRSHKYPSLSHKKYSDSF